MKKRIFIALVLACVLGYYFIPTVIHSTYRFNTNEDLIITNKKLYNSLSQDNLNRNKLDSLYLWFHARGLPIDEDHNKISKSEQWKELISYWKSN